MEKSVSEVVLSDDYAEIIIRDKHGKEKCRSLVSICDIDKIKNITWCFTSSRGYVRGRANGGKIYLHKYILDTASMVDHINGNRLDNRRKNLRLATAAENAWNQKMKKTNTTGYKGVVFSKGRYVAKIRFKSKQIHLGCYSNPKDAANAYDNAAIVFHKEFALTNTMLGLI